MTPGTKPDSRELIAQAREHLGHALWNEAAELATYNIGPATAEAIGWMSSSRGLRRLLDAFEATLNELQAVRSAAQVAMKMGMIQSAGLEAALRQPPERPEAP